MGKSSVTWRILLCMQRYIQTRNTNYQSTAAAVVVMLISTRSNTCQFFFVFKKNCYRRKCEIEFAKQLDLKWPPCKNIVREPPTGGEMNDYYFTLLTRGTLKLIAFGSNKRVKFNVSREVRVRPGRSLLACPPLLLYNRRIDLYVHAVRVARYVA